MTRFFFALTLLNGKNDHERGGAMKGIMWLDRDELVAKEIFKQLTDDPNDWIRGEARKVLGIKNK